MFYQKNKLIEPDTASEYAGYIFPFVFPLNFCLRIINAFVAVNKDSFKNLNAPNLETATLYVILSAFIYHLCNSRFFEIPCSQAN